MSLVPLAAASISSTVVYWSIAWTTLALCLTAAFFPAPWSRKRPRLGRILSHPLALCLGMGLTIFAFRWPPLLFSHMLNADEAQLLAQAITLSKKSLLDALIFYGSVQSGSAGPILTYPLLIPSLFGFEINYGTGRFVGLLLLWSCCIALYYTVRPISGEISARLAAWLATLCLALSYKPDFAHYTSEHPSLPILAFSSLLFFGLLEKEQKRLPLRLFLLGALLASSPFAKLQSTIIALSIAALTYLVMARSEGVDFREKMKRFAFFTAGGLFTPLFFFSLFAIGGVFDYFWQVYIVNNYDYKEAGSPIYENFAFYASSAKARQVNYEIFFFATNAFIAIRLAWWIFDRPHRASRPWRALLFAGVIAGASWFAVIAPGRGFPHYLLLTVIPISLVCGILMSDPGPGGERRGGAPGESASARPYRAPKARQRKKPTKSPEPAAPLWRKLIRGNFLAIPCLFLPLAVWVVRPIYYEIADWYWSIDHLLPRMKEYAAIEGPGSSQVIRETKMPGDYLTVWGWRADYHIETQLPMGTRSACPEFQIRRVPLRDFYRNTALEEFKRTKPAYFIDAVGPLSVNFDDRRLFGHEIFPELTAYLRENYTYAADFGVDRLYVRKDRFVRVFPVIERMQKENNELKASLEVNPPLRQTVP